jgi:hypothetical protein
MAMYNIYHLLNGLLLDTKQEPLDVQTIKKTVQIKLGVKG